MKVQHSLIPLIGSASVLATQQAPWSVKSIVSQAVGSLGFDGSVADAIGHFLVGKKSSKSPERVFEALDINRDVKTFVEKDGMTYQLFTHPDYPQYRVRLKSPKLCDPKVKQYSGYLDIDEDKHLFFWFFESRRNPEEAPLVLWLNGGPGCSSSTGLLFELGPCNIADQGRDTTYNKYGWNEFANMIFLDQPINVGFSYGAGTINNTPVAAEDVYAFLQIFLDGFPIYSKASFSVAAESYGGHYAPHIAFTIHKKNVALKSKSFANTKSKLINLSTVLIGNGFTEPYTQMGSVPKQACDGPYPIYDDPEGPECQSLRSRVPTCQGLIKSCYNFNSRFTCAPAAVYCNVELLGPIQDVGLNPYDTRKKCDRREDADGPLCYRQLGYIETFMNNATVKSELGVKPSIEFKSCNMDVFQGFLGQGDSMRNSAALIPELLAHGVRFLIFAGNADFMCNAIGNLEWMETLDNVFADEFRSAALVPWQTLNTGKVAGKVKSAGGGGFTAGNFTYVVIHESGHMVPFDQPEASLDLFTRWLADVPLDLKSAN